MQHRRHRTPRVLPRRVAINAGHDVRVENAARHEDLVVHHRCREVGRTSGHWGQVGPAIAPGVEALRTVQDESVDAAEHDQTVGGHREVTRRRPGIGLLGHQLFDRFDERRRPGCDERVGPHLLLQRCPGNVRPAKVLQKIGQLRAARVRVVEAPQQRGLQHEVFGGHIDPIGDEIGKDLRSGRLEEVPGSHDLREVPLCALVRGFAQLIQAVEAGEQLQTQAVAGIEVARHEAAAVLDKTPVAKEVARREEVLRLLGAQHQLAGVEKVEKTAHHPRRHISDLYALLPLLPEGAREHGLEVGRAGGQHDAVTRDLLLAEAKPHVGEEVALPARVQTGQQLARVTFVDDPDHRWMRLRVGLEAAAERPRKHLGGTARGGGRGGGQRSGH